MTRTQLRLRTGVAIGALIGLVGSLLGLGLLAPSAGAAPGDLDTTFSTDGVQQLSGTGNNPTLSEVAVAPDGGIVAVGANDTNATNPHMTLFRLLTDGSPDPAFGGGDGLVELPASQVRNGQAVLIAPDGKILVVGVADPNVIAVARFDSTGTLDPAFDGDGVEAVDLPGFVSEQAWGVALDGSGRILIAGDANNGLAGSSFVTLRLLANGGLDPAFGTGGVVTEELGISDGARNVAVDASGRILSAGLLGGPSQSQAALFRYTDTGADDTTFGNGGMITDFMGGNVGFSTGAFQGLVVDGNSPIVGGSRIIDEATDQNAFSVQRYTPAGAPDPEFGGGDGIVTASSTAGDWLLSDLDRRADGFLVAAGLERGPMTVMGQETRGAVAQLTPQGLLDTAFSDDGQATIDLGEGDEAVGVAYDVEGRPVVAGRSVGATPTGTVARFQNHTYRIATLPAGGTLSTGTEATAANPVTTSVTTPVAGTVTITERRVPPTTQGTLSFLGAAVDISAPTATAADPIRIVFRLDATLVDAATTKPLADDIDGLAPFRNGTRVHPCVSPTGTAADPDPCVASKTLDGDDVVLAVRTSRASTWNFVVGPFGGDRYWMAASDGGVFTFGTAAFFGSTGDIKLNSPVVGMTPSPDGNGYWMVAADGGVFAFGSSQFYGSMGSTKLNSPVVAMATTPDGEGYWLVAADGGVFSFGSAQFFGSTGDIKLNKPIVGMDASPDGKGYWMVASDGGIFTFGTSTFFGSMGGSPLNQPIVGMTSSPDGKGYWMVASDGGIFTFGSSTFLGSTGDIKLNKPIVSMAVATDGNGYWMFASDGGVFSFGSAPFLGSLGDIRLNQPVVAGAA